MEGVNWEVIGVGVAFIVACVVVWNTLRGIAKDNREAHNRIENNIKDSEKRVTESVRTDVNRIYDQINTLIGMLGKKN